MHLYMIQKYRYMQFMIYKFRCFVYDRISFQASLFKNMKIYQGIYPYTDFEINQINMKSADYVRSCF